MRPSFFGEGQGYKGLDRIVREYANVLLGNGTRKAPSSHLYLLPLMTEDVVVLTCCLVQSTMALREVAQGLRR